MIRRCMPTLAAIAALVLSAYDVAAQATQGPTDLTTCSTPFRPPAGLTFHGGHAWNVVYHTFPFQFGYATYSALPDPAISDDGLATWSNPGANVECTLTWFYNPDGSVAYIKYNWHIISYRGTITENSGGGCEGGGGGFDDPIYITSYDPYASDPDHDVVVQDCGGGAGGGGGGGLTCGWEWMEIEISYDGGQTWHHFWSGWGQVCEQEA
jgi:hypothetical protein